jgi:hypothetical protein
VRYYSDICLDGLRKVIKIQVRVAGDPAEIRTEHLQNTTLERHLYTNLFSNNSDVRFIVCRTSEMDFLSAFFCFIFSVDNEMGGGG